MTKKVLLFGLDGVRRDSLEQASTPHIDAVAERGGRTAIDIDERCHTVSGPMWSTILTGAFPEEHGVHDNIQQPTMRVPDVFSRLVTAGKAKHPVAAASWPPLTSRVECGPIVNPSLVRAFAAPLRVETPEIYIPGDVMVRDAAIELVGVPEVDGGFVYFGQVDTVGHTEGIGTSYLKAIERCDEHIGSVLNALAARGDRDEWIVVITTDHGHLDTGGHGGRTFEECAVWVVSDSDELLSRITGPQDIASAIEHAYG
ncbi:alkaline phosphatase family protein [Leucobacter denitrificans]|uniref:Alkaline phosphatase family protein n=1 Tax=Leucobacter denitrificans TaxID=683042 RepID=A0A7G9S2M4_9MICO|nr:alkaline phosphatase family protein [Leucobacter denitrificans]QNN62099.1 alkaline phosphatase family protein [Leucobacter denitrificans]